MPASRRPALLLAAAAGFGAFGPGACGERPAAPAAEPPGPRASFVVAAGDSTYWVTRGPGGVRVRASPLFLARWGGRLAEVYVADDERAFDDGAWFAAQRVYRRDLLTGDSALVFADPAVPRLAARHAAAHPDARLLAPDEPADAPDDEGADEDDSRAAPTAESSVALAAAHGPYLSLEQRTTVDAGTEAVPGAGASWDVARRRVFDLRTGRQTSLSALFGADAARLVADVGRRRLAAAVDSLRPGARRALRVAATTAARHAAPGPDVDGTSPEDGDDPRAAVDAARRALAALGTLRLDPDNFGLTARAGAPAVSFVAVGRDPDGTAVTLALAPVVIPGPSPAWWRADVAPTLFVGPGADLADADPGVSRAAGAPLAGVPRADAPRLARWRAAGGSYEVRARVAAGAAVLELASAGAPGATTGGPAAATRQTWPLGRVPAPLAQLFPVDDAATRRALRRAFDESAFYDDAITSVAWRPPARRRSAGRPPTGRPRWAHRWALVSRSVR